MNRDFTRIGGVRNPDARRDVFISYRRNGGSDFARGLEEKLEREGYNVFFDVEDLRGGLFNERLLYFIENCLDFLLVLPKGALNNCKDNPNDWLRTEIECAIKHNKNIIPILLKGFKWPDPETLPESMHNLCFCNALQPSHEYYDASMVKLAEMMRSKPLYIDFTIREPTSYEKLKRALTGRTSVALVAIAVGIGGTLLTQRLLSPVTEGSASSGTIEAAQTTQADLSAYDAGLKKGSAIDQAVRAVLGVTDGELLVKDVEGIADISLSGLSLTDIGELSVLTGLKTLDLHNNKITDLSPLSGLVKLETLLIYGNRVTSLQPLSGMGNLLELSAEDNRIVDVTPLAGLATLTKLFLQNNQIVDVSPLKDLVNLKRLVLDGNPVTDFTPLRNFDTTVFQIPQV